MRRGRLAVNCRCSSSSVDSLLYDTFYQWISAGSPKRSFQKHSYHSSVPSVSQTDLDPRSKNAFLTKSETSSSKRLNGSRLVDFVRSEDLPIQASQGVLRSDPEISFDVFNTQTSLLKPKRYQRRKQQQTQLSSEQPVIIDNLETATILALRLQHFKRGQLSFQELTQFAQSLFTTSRKSAIAEIAALEIGTDEVSAENTIPLEEVQNLIDQPINNEPQRMARVLRALERHGFTKFDLDKWIECIMAPQLHSAFEVMEHDNTKSSSRNWPKFLVLFTLRRYCNSRLAAYDLTRWFSAQYPLFVHDPLVQTKMFFRVLQGVQQWVPDLIPTVCQIAMKHAGPEICTEEVLNQTLWMLSRFGYASIDSRETTLIMQAQSLIVEQMTQNKIPLDTKGYLAIGHVLREESPERARAFLDAIKRHDYPYSADEMNALNDTQHPYHGTFPYLQGPSCLEILLSVTGDQALTAFDSIQSPNSMQWAILLRQLRKLNELTAETTETLWEKIKRNSAERSNVISPHLLSQVIMGLGSLEQARKVIQQYPGYMTSSLALTYIKIACRAEGGRGLNEARQIVSAMEYKPVAAHNSLLAGELYQGNPVKMWQIYDQGIMGPGNNYEPDVWTLYYLCRAAWDQGLIWDGLYAAQRMVVEFKHWVRGAYIDGGDSGDFLKVYPSDQLFYTYIVMLGRAGYHDDLLEVLPWMQRIGFEPSKLCLSALITYSPNGKYLQKHAQVSGVGGNWPTDFELRQFQNNQSKSD